METAPPKPKKLLEQVSDMIKTTMIYTCILSEVEGHVMQLGGLAVKSPSTPNHRSLLTVH